MAQPEARRDELLAELALMDAEDQQDASACPLLFFSTERRPSQRPFFYDTNKVCALLSGNKAGKDECLTARVAILFSRGQYEPLDLPGSFGPFRNMPRIAYGKPLQAWYCVPELDLWQKAIVPKLLNYLPRELLDKKKSSDGSGYNRGDSTIYLLDGSTITGKSYAGFKQDEGKSEGHDLDLVCLSEVPPYFLYKEALSRTLATAGKIWLACTRNEKTCRYPMAWIRNEIIRHPPEVKASAYFLSSKENSDALAAEAEARGLADVAKELRDNWQDSWNLMTEEERAVQLGGEWSGQAGLVFPSFNETQHIYGVKGMTSDVFVQMANAGAGEIVAGMDHGKGHPTVVTYFYIASRPIEQLQIIEGDWIAIWEYYRTHATVVTHLPSLQKNHRRFRPKQYWCDPHMWDDMDAMAGCSPAALYSDPKLLRDIVQARHPGSKVDDLLPVAPLGKGLNKPGSVSAGVQIITAMLKRRDDPFPWPRLRLLPCVKWGKRSFEEWMEKDTEQSGGDDKYSEILKDPMDSFRYPIQRLVGLHCADPLPEQPRMPFDAVTGIAFDQLCSLRGLGV